MKFCSRKIHAGGPPSHCLRTLGRICTIDYVWEVNGTKATLFTLEIKQKQKTEGKMNKSASFMVHHLIKIMPRSQQTRTLNFSEKYKTQNYPIKNLGRVIVGRSSGAQSMKIIKLIDYMKADPLDHPYELLQIFSLDYRKHCECTTNDALSIVIQMKLIFNAVE